MSKETTKYSKEFAVLGTIVKVDESKKLKLKSTDYYQSRLDKLPEGKEVHVVVSTKTPTRSQAQLAYFMVLAQYVAEYNGNTQKEMYPILIEDCFEPTYIIWRGEERKIRESLSDVAKFPKYKMQELITNTLVVCKELEIHVPTAEELGYIKN